LAAGVASRFHGAKQLAEIPVGKERRSSTLVQTSLNAAEGSKADYVILVLGSYASEIVSSLRIGRAIVAFNKDYERGLSTSVRTAISELPAEVQGLVLMVSDQPFLRSTEIDLLINAFQKDNDEPKIIALGFEGEPRNPALFPKRFFSELASLSGDVGGKELIRRHPSEVRLINVPDSKIFVDIDTGSDLSKAYDLKRDVE
jgi:molybdenum cofactor cytidylyltransferase